MVKREQSQTGLNFDEREKIGLKVKRLFQWVMAAILICGAATFTSCTNEDNPATPDLNVAEKIIGKWVVTDKNSQPAPTDIKSIHTFVSATQAYISQSFIHHLLSLIKAVGDFTFPSRYTSTISFLDSAFTTAEPTP